MLSLMRSSVFLGQDICTYTHAYTRTRSHTHVTYSVRCGKPAPLTAEQQVVRETARIDLCQGYIPLTANLREGCKEQ